MAVYDNRQMNSIRQEAMRRSREMYRRPIPEQQSGKSSYHGKNESFDNNESLKTAASTSENQRTFQLNSRKSKKENELKELLGKLFGGKIDSDKLMIIALMIILAREGADIKLILALAYILM